MCDEFNMIMHINNLGDLTWYGGCHYSRDKERGLLTISQQAFIQRLVEKYGHGSSTSISDSLGINLEDFEGDWSFREVVGSLMWLANQTRSDIANAVRAVARYCHAPMSVQWKAVLTRILQLSLVLHFNKVVVFNLRCSQVLILRARQRIGSRFQGVE